MLLLTLQAPSSLFMEYEFQKWMHFCCINVYELLKHYGICHDCVTLALKNADGGFEPPCAQHFATSGYNADFPQSHILGVLHSWAEGININNVIWYY